MSRIGKKPISVAAGIDVTIQPGLVKIKGPKGELTQTVHPAMKVAWDAGVRRIEITRPDDARQSRALHGLTRALIANMVQGVVTPYEKKLEIVGVGYQATLKGKKLALQVGYANVVELPIPAGVTCVVPQPTQILLSSIDKHAVGQFAANIRRVRPPEPYKGKGIKYHDEVIRRKAGKAFGS